jgi:hypothetical protein
MRIGEGAIRLRQGTANGRYCLLDGQILKPSAARNAFDTSAPMGGARCRHVKLGENEGK